MERLTQSQIVMLLGKLRDIYATRTLSAFRAETLSALHDLIPSDSNGYNEVDVQHQRAIILMNPTDARFPNSDAIFERHMHEHPVIEHYAETGDGSALKLSDFLSRRQLHDLGLYAEHYSRVGAEYQMAVTLPSAASIVIGIAMNRTSRDFSERDRTCLEVMRPHLIQAFRNAQAAEHQQQTLAFLMNHDAAGSSRGIVMLDRYGRVRTITRPAYELLVEFYGRGPKVGASLPSDLAQWHRQQQSLLERTDDVPFARRPLTVMRDQRSLVVRVLAGADHSVLLLEAQAPLPHAPALRRLGLTNRETEVLTWVARGKTNADIAAILGLSPRTVEKHLERIFQQLGVETRTAAATRARELAEEA